MEFNWVIFSVLTGLALFNLLGIALYHLQWHKEYKPGEWKCKQFYIWTACMFVFGICYCCVRLFEWIKLRNDK